jgi:hypothetical protein
MRDLAAAGQVADRIKLVVIQVQNLKTAPVDGPFIGALAEVLLITAAANDSYAQSLTRS